MKFISTLQKFDSDLWGHHVPIPTDIARKFMTKESKRVICTLSGSLSFPAALMPMGNDEWFINVNKKNRAKLGLVEGQEVQVELAVDTSKYGMPMPEELEELLAQDELGLAAFEKLTPGKQRNLIHIVASVKSPNIRLRRAIVIVRHIVEGESQIDFKLLQQQIKEANQQGL